MFVMPCFVLFYFVSWDLPNHPASCRALGIFGKLLMKRGASKLFGATVWKLLIIEPLSQWKLNKIKTENSTGIWGCSWNSIRESGNRVYFTIFRATVLKILTFEWILSLEIQINCKKWVWTEKSVDPFTLPNLEIFNSENERMCLALGPTAFCLKWCQSETYDIIYLSLWEVYNTQ